MAGLLDGECGEWRKTSIKTSKDTERARKRVATLPAELQFKARGK